ncbi:hypothetical protein [Streptomyces sp. RTd22]|uniref:hypothetical protein n=1 Tax=Streptomyces sp. RTd22 TaxID=1841249 RepID=UPI00131CFF3E|nr:hypothetical protein [Streptomyces sp. RTd22]
MLLIGRTEDAPLKGVDLAAAACGRVATWLHEDGPRRLRLLVHGAPEAAVNEQRATITKWAANPQLEVLVRAYASAEERVANDLNSGARAAAVVLGAVAPRSPYAGANAASDTSRSSTARWNS